MHLYYVYGYYIKFRYYNDQASQDFMKKINWKEMIKRWLESNEEHILMLDTRVFNDKGHHLDDQTEENTFTEYKMSEYINNENFRVPAIYHLMLGNDHIIFINEYIIRYNQLLEMYNAIYEMGLTNIEGKIMHHGLPEELNDIILPDLTFDDRHLDKKDILKAGTYNIKLVPGWSQFEQCKDLEWHIKTRAQDPSLIRGRAIKLRDKALKIKDIKKREELLRKELPKYFKTVNHGVEMCKVLFNDKELNKEGEEVEIKKGINRFLVYRTDGYTSLRNKHDKYKIGFTIYEIYGY